jgi:exosortase D (VPLPA-CTERM-specific)
VLYRGPLRRKLALLFAAVPLAVAMNALRIGVIGILVDRQGPGAATGFLHLFEGWVVFLSCIGILLGMAAALQRLAGDRSPLGAALDLDFSGLGAQLARVRDVAPSPALVAAAGLTAALSAAWMLAPARPASEPVRDRFDRFPAALAGWSGTAAPLAPDVERALAADDYLAAVYRHPAEAQPVDLFVSYYLRQTEGGWIHSPAVCLPGAGWEVSAIRAVTVPLPGSGLALNRAVIQKGLERQLVYYWFAGRGRALTNDFAAKFYTVADSLVRGRTDGGLVRLITPIGPGEAAADADARLGRFLAAVATPLPRFIPD